MWRQGRNGGSGTTLAGRGRSTPGTPRDDSPVAWSTLRERIDRGEEDLGRWTLEELERCQKRTDHGWVPSKSPNTYPRAIVQELHKRRYLDVERVIIDGGVPAARALVNMAEGREKANMARVRSCEIILDRMLGKPKETVDINIESTPLEQAVARLGEIASAVAWAGAVGQAVDGRAVMTGWKGEDRLRAELEAEGQAQAQAQSSSTIVEAEIIDDEEIM